jgi:hypothetical protein
MDLSGASLEEMSAEIARRTSGIDALDSFFELPAWVTDQAMRNGYETVVARMRRECMHVPMNTVQQLLIERIAFNYILLKHKESAPLGTDDGFSSPEAIKDFNTFWLKMTAEFNNLLVKFRPSDKEAIMSQVKGLTEEILATLDNKSIRNDLIHRFVTSYERAGLV